MSRNGDEVEDSDDETTLPRRDLPGASPAGDGQFDDVVSGMNRYQSDSHFYPPNIDVLTPLQFLVGDDSVLRIPSDSQVAYAWIL